jgi:large subunit ribosomal protein L22
MYFCAAEAWVNKGPRSPPQLEPRGRGHFGLRRHPNSKMIVVLREGKTLEEKKGERRKKILKRIVSAGVNREDVPLRNPSPTWTW